MTDPIADMLTRIRNAAVAKKELVDMPGSRLKLELVQILKAQGFVKNFKVIQENKRESLRVFLKYDEQKKSVIMGLEKVSTPGRRVYVGVDNIPLIRKGLGVVILSTNKGLMTDKDARKEKVGGEILCRVW
jgi:small subunit ribosomal protein S8